MFQFSATTTINASPDRIWKILTDAPGYPTWDPGVLRIEGEIAPGKKVTAYTKAAPKRAFPAVVGNFEPGRKMTWTGGMPLGLFKGVRSFTLTPQANNSVEFTLREVYSGPMLPLIKSSIPDLTHTFEDFVAGLKNYAEQAK
jgi:hypothetical protein